LLAQYAADQYVGTQGVKDSGIAVSGADKWL
jgi:hypothetical protein